jgi:predicted aconitase
MPSRDRLPTPELSHADRAVRRALRDVTQGDSRAAADPQTPEGQSELAALYIAKAHATWEELRRAHQASSTERPAPSEILSVSAAADIAAHYTELVNTAVLWSDQILTEATVRTGTPLTRAHTLQPPLLWSLAHLLARDGDAASTIQRHVLDTLADSAR